MIPAALLCTLAVALVAAVYLGRAGRRPLSERIVDALYRLAHIAAAAAYAADQTLCEYRAQTAEHRSQYAREAR